MTLTHSPSYRAARKGRRAAHTQPITNSKALKTPGEAAHIASKKKSAWLKEREEVGQTTELDDRVPPCQNGYWIRAPSKVEREALPPFPTLNMQHVHIPRSPSELAEARVTLLSADILGFDTETKPAFVKGQRDNGGPHLVQLATTTDVWLLMIHRVPGALALAREVMASQSILKVGFGLKNDVQTLPGKLGAQLKNVFDFDSRFAKVGYGGSLGVRGAVAVVFNQDFRKSKKQTLANWAGAHYTPPMILYAANDAWVPAVLWAEMEQWEDGRVDTRKWFKAGVQRIARQRADTKTLGLRLGPPPMEARSFAATGQPGSSSKAADGSSGTSSRSTGQQGPSPKMAGQHDDSEGDDVVYMGQRGPVTQRSAGYSRRRVDDPYSLLNRLGPR